MPPATSKPAGGRGHLLLVILFVVFLILLVWTILWKLTLPWVGEAAFLPHPIKLIPFLPSGDADASAPQEVVANLLLFVPFGLYLGMLAPRWQWWKAAGMFVGASLLLEITQHVLSVGSFDVTDVIMNTAGGIAGLGMLALARRRLQDRTVPAMTTAFVIGTALSLIAIGILIASPLHYEPRHDVIFGQQAY
ncbi:MAG: VanZ family protein [Pseudolysinimonas sp.]